MYTRRCAKFVAIALMLAGITACGGSKRYNIDTWVSKTENSSFEQRIARLSADLAEAVPDADRSWAFSGRLFSWNPTSAAPRFTYGNRPWWEMNERSRLKRGGVIEATVQFDMRPGVPVYRVILEPIDFPASAMASWQGFLVLDTGLNTDDESDEQLFAPLDTAVRTDDGRLITDWVYCGHCVADGPVEGDGAQLIRLRQYASSYGTRDPSPQWLEDWSYRSLAVGSSGTELFTGDAAFAAARRAAQAADEALAAREAQAEQNAAYARFFREEHDPLSFETFSARSDCPQGYAGYTPIGNDAGTHADEAREAEAYARCQRSLLERYDFEGYVRRYPELAAREAELFARTSGIDRRDVLSPQDQLDLATGRIERAFASADKSWARADRIAANDAERRRQQAINRQVFMQTQAAIDAWQRDVAGMAPVVRADGTLTTVNAERQRAAFAARAAAFRAEAEDDRASGTASASRTSGASAGSGASAEAASARTATEERAAVEPSLPPLVGGTHYYATLGWDSLPAGQDIPRCTRFGLPGDTSRARCRVLQHIEVPMLQSYCLPNRGSEAYTAGAIITVVSVDGVTESQSRKIAADAANTQFGFAAYNPSTNVHSAVLDALEARRWTIDRQRYFRSVGALERAHVAVCGPDVPLHWD
ncbi:MAG: hypothetical protein V2J24_21500 [Pseudomonadales bacterium]|jgi:hypothetical protein|nr:hypothetical protein [Pseudomonadales bacterium]